MKITTILFDLDGVLVSTKHLHFTVLNEALSECDDAYVISWQEHVNTYDGLKTREKLARLTAQKGLPSELHDPIWKRKQELLHARLHEIRMEPHVRETVQSLKSQGFKLGCCSNSIRSTVEAVLRHTGLEACFDVVLSNEDVDRAKPCPEIYWRAMMSLGTSPEQTLVVEDSPHGMTAAHRSHAFLFRVSGPADVQHGAILEFIEELQSSPIGDAALSLLPRWRDGKMNVLIPMAGAGSRFEKAGYALPKPLIDVDGKPMIQVVVENLRVDAHFIFVVQKAHRKQYGLDVLLRMIAPDCTIVETDGLTEGAACTSLLAKAHIDNDRPLFFANSDQFVEWNSLDFFYKMQETACDGGMAIFEASDPKWSFAEVDPSTGSVTRVAEKDPISTHATVGFYFWKRGSDFVKYAEQMISNNIRVNNEFYVCPVFNQAIADGKVILTYDICRMWGLGTPEDLEIFLSVKGKESSA